VREDKKRKGHREKKGKRKKWGGERMGKRARPQKFTEMTPLC